MILRKGGFIMKRLTALLTVSLMTASMFTGCGDSDNNSESDIASERSSLSDTKPDNSTKEKMSEEETSVVVTEAEPINLEDTVKSELDLYEDILKNPNAHTAIIDPDSRNYNSYTYCIADINDDGKYELVLKSENKEGSYDPYGVLTVVKADGKVYKWEFSNTPEFYANGIVGYSHVSTHFTQSFLDINSGDMWNAYTDYGHETAVRVIENIVTGEIIEGSTENEKEKQLSSGAVIKPKWTAYSWYDAEDMEIVVSEKKDIEYSWKDAYSEYVQKIEDSGHPVEVALIYIDNDEIPELVTSESPVHYTVCSFSDGKINVVDAEGRFEGYIPKKGIYGISAITFSEGEDRFFKEYRFDSGKKEQLHNLKCNVMGMDGGVPSKWDCCYDEKSISKSEYEIICQELIEKYTKPEYSTINEAISIFNSERGPIEDTTEGIVITENDALNVRTSPSVDAPVIGQVPKGNVVHITGEDGDWYKIRFGSEIGYVSKEYVALTIE